MFSFVLCIMSSFQGPVRQLLHQGSVVNIFWKSCIWHDQEIKGLEITVFVDEGCAFCWSDIIDVNVTKFYFICIRDKYTFSIIGLLKWMLLKNFHWFHLFFYFWVCFNILSFEIFQKQIFPIFNTWHCCVERTIVDSSFVWKIYENFF